jgi:transcriptional regulator with XRE-family HTH domain
MPGIIKAIGYLPIVIDTSTLGGRIRYYRYLNGISQEELAKRFGLNETTVFHYEKGAHRPLAKTLKRLEALITDF